MQTKTRREYGFRSEDLHKQANLLRKNAEFLRELDTAVSVQLYSSFWHERVNDSPGSDAWSPVIGIDYYALVGINGNVEKVVPWPILVKLLGQPAQDILNWLMSGEFTARHASKYARDCNIGRHDDPQFHHRYPDCPCYWHRESGLHTSREKCDECLGSCLIHCKICRASWSESESPPATPFDFEPIDQPILVNDQRFGRVLARWKPKTK